MANLYTCYLGDVVILAQIFQERKERLALVIIIVYWTLKGSSREGGGGTNTGVFALFEYL